MHKKTTLKKYVIYSAIIGNYDNIQQPQLIHDDFDYIIFSNTINEKRIGIWEIKKINYKNPDMTRIARWVKTHPEQLVKDYIFSIWIDANIQILTNEFYQRAIELYNGKELISSMWHNERDCIYEEAVSITLGSLDTERTILDWEHKLLKEKYPQHNGLCETNVLYRNHNDTQVKNFDNLWWSCIQQYSRRDQLSFNYALWKLRIKCPYYLPYGENTRNSNCIKWTSHHNEKNRQLSTNILENKLVIYFKNISSDKDKLNHIYQTISLFATRHVLAGVIGQYYRLKIHFRNFIKTD